MDGISAALLITSLAYPFPLKGVFFFHSNVWHNANVTVLQYGVLQNSITYNASIDVCQRYIYLFRIHCYFSGVNNASHFTSTIGDAGSLNSQQSAKSRD